MSHFRTLSFHFVHQFPCNSVFNLRFHSFPYQAVWYLLYLLLVLILKSILVFECSILCLINCNWRFFKKVHSLGLYFTCAKLFWCGKHRTWTSFQHVAKYQRFVGFYFSPICHTSDPPVRENCLYENLHIHQSNQEHGKGAKETKVK